MLWGHDDHQFICISISAGHGIISHDFYLPSSISHQCLLSLPGIAWNFQCRNVLLNILHEGAEQTNQAKHCQNIVENWKCWKIESILYRHLFIIPNSMFKFVWRVYVNISRVSYLYLSQYKLVTLIIGILWEIRQTRIILFKKSFLHLPWLFCE